MRRCWLLPVLIVMVATGARARQSPASHEDGTQEAGALAPRLDSPLQARADSAASNHQATQEDLVLYSGPCLGPMNIQETAPRIFLTGDFQKDRSLGNDFSLVARDVGRIVRRLFDLASPPVNKPIVCWIGGPLPLIDATSDHRFVFIRIALTDLDLRRRNYCRFAYQLSHELGHLYLDPRRSNGLIETLADSIAYQSLAVLSELWRSRPTDRDEIKAYAPLFVVYREKKTAEKMEALPFEITGHLRSGHSAAVRSYLEQHAQELDKNPYDKTGLALRGLAATVFPQGRSWKPFAGIAGLTDPSPAQDGRYREGFPTQIGRAPQSAREALAAIGRR